MSALRDRPGKVDRHLPDLHRGARRSHGRADAADHRGRRARLPGVRLDPHALRDEREGIAVTLLDRVRAEVLHRVHARTAALVQVVELRLVQVSQGVVHERLVLEQPEAEQPANGTEGVGDDLAKHEDWVRD